MYKRNVESITKEAQRYCDYFESNHKLGMNAGQCYAFNIKPNIINV